MAILLRVVIRAARNTSNTSNSALQSKFTICIFSLVRGNNILFVIRSEEQDEQILYGLALVDEITRKAAADILLISYKLFLWWSYR